MDLPPSTVQSRDPPTQQEIDNLHNLIELFTTNKDPSDRKWRLQNIAIWMLKYFSNCTRDDVIRTVQAIELNTYSFVNSVLLQIVEFFDVKSFTLHYLSIKILDGSTLRLLDFLLLLIKKFQFTANVFPTDICTLIVKIISTCLSFPPLSKTLGEVLKVFVAKLSELFCFLLRNSESCLQMFLKTDGLRILLCGATCLTLHPHLYCVSATLHTLTQFVFDELWSPSILTDLQEKPTIFNIIDQLKLYDEKIIDAPMLVHTYSLIAKLCLLPNPAQAQTQPGSNVPQSSLSIFPLMDLFLEQGLTTRMACSILKLAFQHSEIVQKRIEGDKTAGRLPIEQRIELHTDTTAPPVPPSRDFDEILPPPPLPDSTITLPPPPLPIKGVSSTNTGTSNEMEYLQICDPAELNSEFPFYPRLPLFTLPFNLEPLNSRDIDLSSNASMENASHSHVKILNHQSPTIRNISPYLSFYLPDSSLPTPSTHVSPNSPPPNLFLFLFTTISSLPLPASHVFFNHVLAWFQSDSAILQPLPSDFNSFISFLSKQHTLKHPNDNSPSFLSLLSSSISHPLASQIYLLSSQAPLPYHSASLLSSNHPSSDSPSLQSFLAEGVRQTGTDLMTIEKEAILFLLLYLISFASVNSSPLITTQDQQDRTLLDTLAAHDTSDESVVISEPIQPQQKVDEAQTKHQQNELRKVQKHIQKKANEEEKKRKKELKQKQKKKDQLGTPDLDPAISAPVEKTIVQKRSTFSRSLQSLLSLSRFVIRQNKPILTAAQQLTSSELTPAELGAQINSKIGHFQAHLPWSVFPSIVITNKIVLDTLLSIFTILPSFITLEHSKKSQRVGGEDSRKRETGESGKTLFCLPSSYLPLVTSSCSFIQETILSSLFYFSLMSKNLTDPICTPTLFVLAKYFAAKPTDTLRLSNTLPPHHAISLPFFSSFLTFLFLTLTSRHLQHHTVFGPILSNLSVFLTLSSHPSHISMYASFLSLLFHAPSLPYAVFETIDTLRPSPHTLQISTESPSTHFTDSLSKFMSFFTAPHSKFSSKIIRVMQLADVWDNAKTLIRTIVPSVLMSRWDLTTKMENSNATPQELFLRESEKNAMIKNLVCVISDETAAKLLSAMAVSELPLFVSSSQIISEENIFSKDNTFSESHSGKQETDPSPFSFSGKTEMNQLVPTITPRKVTFGKTVRTSRLDSFELIDPITPPELEASPTQSALFIQAVSRALNPQIVFILPSILSIFSAPHLAQPQQRSAYLHNILGIFSDFLPSSTFSLATNPAHYLIPSDPFAQETIIGGKDPKMVTPTFTRVDENKKYHVMVFPPSHLLLQRALNKYSHFADVTSLNNVPVSVVALNEKGNLDEMIPTHPLFPLFLLSFEPSFNSSILTLLHHYLSASNPSSSENYSEQTNQIPNLFYVLYPMIYTMVSSFVSDMKDKFTFMPISPTEHKEEESDDGEVDEEKPERLQSPLEQSQGFNSFRTNVFLKPLLQTLSFYSLHSSQSLATQLIFVESGGTMLLHHCILMVTMKIRELVIDERKGKSKTEEKRLVSQKIRSGFRFEHSPLSRSATAGNLLTSSTAFKLALSELSVVLIQLIHTLSVSLTRNILTQSAHTSQHGFDMLYSCVSQLFSYNELAEPLWSGKGMPNMHKILRHSLESLGNYFPFILQHQAKMEDSPSLLYLILNALVCISCDVYGSSIITSIEPPTKTHQLVQTFNSLNMNFHPSVFATPESPSFSALMRGTIAQAESRNVLKPEQILSGVNSSSGSPVSSPTSPNPSFMISSPSPPLIDSSHAYHFPLVLSNPKWLALAFRLCSRLPRTSASCNSLLSSVLSITDHLLGLHPANASSLSSLSFSYDILRLFPAEFLTTASSSTTHYIHSIFVKIFPFDRSPLTLRTLFGLFSISSKLQHLITVETSPINPSLFYSTFLSITNSLFQTNRKNLSFSSSPSVEFNITERSGAVLELPTLVSPSAFSDNDFISIVQRNRLLTTPTEASLSASPNDASNLSLPKRLQQLVAWPPTKEGRYTLSFWFRLNTFEKVSQPIPIFTISDLLFTKSAEDHQQRLSTFSVRLDVQNKQLIVSTDHQSDHFLNRRVHNVKEKTGGLNRTIYAPLPSHFFSGNGESEWHYITIVHHNKSNTLAKPLCIIHIDGLVNSLHFLEFPTQSFSQTVQLKKHTFGVGPVAASPEPGKEKEGKDLIRHNFSIYSLYFGSPYAIDHQHSSHANVSFSIGSSFLITAALHPLLIRALSLLPPSFPLTMLSQDETAASIPFASSWKFPLPLLLHKTLLYHPPHTTQLHSFERTLRSQSYPHSVTSLGPNSLFRLPIGEAPTPLCLKGDLNVADASENCWWLGGDYLINARNSTEPFFKMFGKTNAKVSPQTLIHINVNRFAFCFSPAHLNDACYSPNINRSLLESFNTTSQSPSQTIPQSLPINSLYTEAQSVDRIVSKTVALTPNLTNIPSLDTHTQHQQIAQKDVEDMPMQSMQYNKPHSSATAMYTKPQFSDPEEKKSGAIGTPTSSLPRNMTKLDLNSEEETKGKMADINVFFRPTIPALGDAAVINVCPQYPLCETLPYPPFALSPLGTDSQTALFQKSLEQASQPLPFCSRPDFLEPHFMFHTECVPYEACSIVAPSKMSSKVVHNIPFPFSPFTSHSLLLLLDASTTSETFFAALKTFFFSVLCSQASFHEASHSNAFGLLIHILQQHHQKFEKHVTFQTLLMVAHSLIVASSDCGVAGSQRSSSFEVFNQIWSDFNTPMMGEDDEAENRTLKEVTQHILDLQNPTLYNQELFGLLFLNPTLYSLLPDDDDGEKCRLTRNRLEFFTLHFVHSLISNANQHKEFNVDRLREIDTFNCLIHIFFKPNSTLDTSSSDSEQIIHSIPHHSYFVIASCSYLFSDILSRENEHDLVTFADLLHHLIRIMNSQAERPAVTGDDIDWVQFTICHLLDCLFSVLHPYRHHQSRDSHQTVPIATVTKLFVPIVLAVLTSSTLFLETTALSIKLRSIALSLLVAQIILQPELQTQFFSDLAEQTKQVVNDVTAMSVERRSIISSDINAEFTEALKPNSKTNFSNPVRLFEPIKQSQPATASPHGTFAQLLPYLLPLSHEPEAYLALISLILQDVSLVFPESFCVDSEQEGKHVDLSWDKLVSDFNRVRFFPLGLPFLYALLSQLAVHVTKGQEFPEMILPSLVVEPLFAEPSFSQESTDHAIAVFPLRTIPPAALLKDVSMFIFHLHHCFTANFISHQRNHVIPVSITIDFTNIPIRRHISSTKSVTSTPTQKSRNPIAQAKMVRTASNPLLDEYIPPTSGPLSESQLVTNSLLLDQLDKDNIKTVIHYSVAVNKTAKEKQKEEEVESDLLDAMTTMMLFTIGSPIAPASSLLHATFSASTQQAGPLHTIFLSLIQSWVRMSIRFSSLPAPGVLLGLLFNEIPRTIPSDVIASFFTCLTIPILQEIAKIFEPHTHFESFKCELGEIVHEDKIEPFLQSNLPSSSSQEDVFYASEDHPSGIMIYDIPDLKFNSPMTHQMADEMEQWVSNSSDAIRLNVARATLQMNGKIPSNGKGRWELTDEQILSMIPKEAVFEPDLAFFNDETLYSQSSQNQLQNHTTSRRLGITDLISTLSWMVVGSEMQELSDVFFKTVSLLMTAFFSAYGRFSKDDKTNFVVDVNAIKAPSLSTSVITQTFAQPNQASLESFLFTQSDNLLITILSDADLVGYTNNLFRMEVEDIESAYIDVTILPTVQFVPTVINYQSDRTKGTRLVFKSPYTIPDSVIGWTEASPAPSQPSSQFTLHSTVPHLSHLRPLPMIDSLTSPKSSGTPRGDYDPFPDIDSIQSSGSESTKGEIEARSPFPESNEAFSELIRESKRMAVPNPPPSESALDIVPFHQFLLQLVLAFMHPLSKSMSAAQISHSRDKSDHSFDLPAIAEFMNFMSTTRINSVLSSLLDLDKHIQDMILIPKARTALSNILNPLDSDAFGSFVPTFVVIDNKTHGRASSKQPTPSPPTPTKPTPKGPSEESLFKTTKFSFVAHSLLTPLVLQLYSHLLSFYSHLLIVSVNQTSRVIPGLLNKLFQFINQLLRSNSGRLLNDFFSFARDKSILDSLEPPTIKSGTSEKKDMEAVPVIEQHHLSTTLLHLFMIPLNQMKFEMVSPVSHDSRTFNFTNCIESFVHHIQTTLGTPTHLLVSFIKTLQSLFETMHVFDKELADTEQSSLARDTLTLTQKNHKAALDQLIINSSNDKKVESYLKAKLIQHLPPANQKQRNTVRFLALSDHGTQAFSLSSFLFSLLIKYYSTSHAHTFDSASLLFFSELYQTQTMLHTQWIDIVAYETNEDNGWFSLPFASFGEWLSQSTIHSQSSSLVDFTSSPLGPFSFPQSPSSASISSVSSTDFSVMSTPLNPHFNLLPQSIDSNLDAPSAIHQLFTPILSRLSLFHSHSTPLLSSTTLKSRLNSWNDCLTREGSMRSLKRMIVSYDIARESEKNQTPNRSPKLYDMPAVSLTSSHSSLETSRRLSQPGFDLKLGEESDIQQAKHAKQLSIAMFPSVDPLRESFAEGERNMSIKKISELSTQTPLAILLNTIDFSVMISSLVSAFCLTLHTPHAPTIALFNASILVSAVQLNDDIQGELNEKMMKNEIDLMLTKQIGYPYSSDGVDVISNLQSLVSSTSQKAFTEASSSVYSKHVTDAITNTDDPIPSTTTHPTLYLDRTAFSKAIRIHLGRLREVPFMERSKSSLYTTLIFQDRKKTITGNTETVESSANDLLSSRTAFPSVSSCVCCGKSSHPHSENTSPHCTAASFPTIRSLNLSSIIFIARRRFSSLHIAIEIFTEDAGTLFFAFDSVGTRERVYGLLCRAVYNAEDNESIPVQSSYDSGNRQHWTRVGGRVVDEEGRGGKGIGENVECQHIWDEEWTEAMEEQLQQEEALDEEEEREFEEALNQKVLALSQPSSKISSVPRPATPKEFIQRLLSPKLPVDIVPTGTPPLSPIRAQLSPRSPKVPTPQSEIFPTISPELEHPPSPIMSAGVIDSSPAPIVGEASPALAEETEEEDHSVPPFKRRECLLPSMTRRIYEIPLRAVVRIPFTPTTTIPLPFLNSSSSSHHHQTNPQRMYLSLPEALSLWCQGAMTNFDYLNFINICSGRSLSDLAQYPIFPWVLRDYTSTSLDLANPTSYRDLSLPMGAQVPLRKEKAVEQYQMMEMMGDPNLPPYHFGTHYSTSLITLYYLVRLPPYTTRAIHLQGGKFDNGDRLFHSIEEAWNSAGCSNQINDVKELIPEFFSDPSFLKSHIHAGKLGRRSPRVPAEWMQNLANQLLDHTAVESGIHPLRGRPLHDVVLPPWANGDPELFVKKNRQALESPFVSAHLHHWIDLIFGYKQRGKAAIDAINVFHPATYAGCTDYTRDTDRTLRLSSRMQINSFGQIPLQLFTTPHPPRHAISAATPLIDGMTRIVPVQSQLIQQVGQIMNDEDGQVKEESRIEGIEDTKDKVDTEKDPDAIRPAQLCLLSKIHHEKPYPSGPMIVSSALKSSLLKRLGASLGSFTLQSHIDPLPNQFLSTESFSHSHLVFPFHAGHLKSQKMSINLHFPIQHNLGERKMAEPPTSVSPSPTQTDLKLPQPSILLSNSLNQVTAFSTAVAAQNGRLSLANSSFREQRFEACFEKSGSISNLVPLPPNHFPTASAKISFPSRSSFSQYLFNSDPSIDPLGLILKANLESFHKLDILALTEHPFASLTVPLSCLDISVNENVKIISLITTYLKQFMNQHQRILLTPPASEDVILPNQAIRMSPSDPIVTEDHIHIDSLSFPVPHFFFNHSFTLPIIPQKYNSTSTLSSPSVYHLDKEKQKIPLSSLYIPTLPTIKSFVQTIFSPILMPLSSLLSFSFNSTLYATSVLKAIQTAEVGELQVIPSGEPIPQSTNLSQAVPVFNAAAITQIMSLQPDPSDSKHVSLHAPPLAYTSLSPLFASYLESMTQLFGSQLHPTSTVSSLRFRTLTPKLPKAIRDFLVTTSSTFQALPQPVQKSLQHEFKLIDNSQTWKKKQTVVSGKKTDFFIAPSGKTTFFTEPEANVEDYQNLPKLSGGDSSVAMHVIKGERYLEEIGRGKEVGKVMGRFEKKREEKRKEREIIWNETIDGVRRGFVLLAKQKPTTLSALPFLANPFKPIKDTCTYQDDPHSFQSVSLATLYEPRIMYDFNKELRQFEKVIREERVRQTVDPTHRTVSKNLHSPVQLRCEYVALVRNETDIEIWRFSNLQPDKAQFHFNMFKSTDTDSVETTFIGSLHGHLFPITTVEVHPVANVLVSGDDSGLVIVWDLNRMCMLRSFDTRILDEVQTSEKQSVQMKDDNLLRVVLDTVQEADSFAAYNLKDVDGVLDPYLKPRHLLNPIKTLLSSTFGMVIKRAVQKGSCRPNHTQSALASLSVDDTVVCLPPSQPFSLLKTRALLDPLFTPRDSSFSYNRNSVISLTFLPDSFVSSSVTAVVLSPSHMSFMNINNPLPIIPDMRIVKDSTYPSDFSTSLLPVDPLKTSLGALDSRNLFASVTVVSTFSDSETTLMTTHTNGTVSFWTITDNGWDWGNQAIRTEDDLLDSISSEAADTLPTGRMLENGSVPESVSVVSSILSQILTFVDFSSQGSIHSFSRRLQPFLRLRRSLFLNWEADLPGGKTSHQSTTNYHPPLPIAAVNFPALGQVFIATGSLFVHTLSIPDESDDSATPSVTHQFDSFVSPRSSTLSPAFAHLTQRGNKQTDLSFLTYQFISVNYPLLSLSFSYDKLPQSHSHWHSDDTRTTCALCRTAFSSIRRRHHCRRCGLVVCEKCSVLRMTLPGCGFVKVRVRVCVGCYCDVLHLPFERCVRDLPATKVEEKPKKEKKKDVRIEEIGDDEQVSHNSDQTVNTDENKASSKEPTQKYSLTHKSIPVILPTTSSFSSRSSLVYQHSLLHTTSLNVQFLCSPSLHLDCKAPTVQRALVSSPFFSFPLDPKLTWYDSQLPLLSSLFSTPFSSFFLSSFSQTNAIPSFLALPQAVSFIRSGWGTTIQFRYVKVRYDSEKLDHDNEK
ncbi:putative Lysosomal-trafficking regulator [Blattamonas nauphoetae]|uniref:Lysosomal-trafficking regulator n=1 Tax=Blattamonas nauphoetae TaxID=2049346 RepID=A0ABQ9YI62_9EUKA|nr:putative Lysosomal-trafficking regulator [Blattamonas nauphoetae]